MEITELVKNDQFSMSLLTQPLSVNIQTDQNGRLYRIDLRADITNNAVDAFHLYSFLFQLAVGCERMSLFYTRIMMILEDLFELVDLFSRKDCSGITSKPNSKGLDGDYNNTTLEMINSFFKIHIMSSSKKRQ